MADTSTSTIIDDIERPIILFDGVCNLCNAFVRFTVRFDASGRFHFASLQSAIGQALLDKHDLPTDEFDSFVLLDGESYYTRSTAVLRICRHLDGPWPLLSPLVYVPNGLRDPIYELVAKNRYHVLGRTDECPVPSPKLRERFAERTLDTT